MREHECHSLTDYKIEIGFYHASVFHLSPISRCLHNYLLINDIIHLAITTSTINLIITFQIYLLSPSCSLLLSSTEPKKDGNLFISLSLSPYFPSPPLHLNNDCSLNFCG